VAASQKSQKAARTPNQRDQRWYDASTWGRYAHERPNSSWWLVSRLPRGLALPCRGRCSPPRTRWIRRVVGEVGSPNFLPALKACHGPLLHKTRRWRPHELHPSGGVPVHPSKV